MSLSFSPCVSLESLQTGGLWGWLEGGENGGKKKGGCRRLRISSSAPAWTPEPQCGVPVHILKPPRLSAPRWVLFVPPPRPPPPPNFCQFFYLYFYLPFFLVALTSPDGSFFSSMQQRADESGWAESPPPPSCLPSPLLSLSLQTKSAGRRWTSANPSTFFFFNFSVSECYLLV